MKIKCVYNLLFLQGRQLAELLSNSKQLSFESPDLDSILPGLSPEWFTSQTEYTETCVRYCGQANRTLKGTVR